ncbi:hypothetical protein [Granulicella sibirica]|uniref:Uncharacterized protein n=1 Tax=Granulicella sibirica TaxID=2479048 RepID=A0A4Q0T8H4_9BACT|nr:hypothetical protein [Granulicella sibirica]RXH58458.1 hypothetical protein GRAN_1768 [Granulicella sibirica]
MVLAILITLGGFGLLLLVDYWRAWAWAERQVSSARKRADIEARRSAWNLLQTTVRVGSGWRPTWSHDGELSVRVSAHL